MTDRPTYGQTEAVKGSYTSINLADALVGEKSFLSPDEYRNSITDKTLTITNSLGGQLAR